jgi:hypothetical protein
MTESECNRIHKLPEESSPYVVLGVPPDSKKDTIQNAYKRLALECHPDRPNNIDKSFFTDVFQKITAANKALNTHIASLKLPEDRLSTTSHIDNDIQSFGPTLDMTERRKDKLKKWLSILISQTDLLESKLTFEDVNIFFNKNVLQYLEAYDTSDPLIYNLIIKLQELAISTFLQQPDFTSDINKQCWTLINIRKYIEFNSSKKKQEDKIQSGIFEGIINEPQFREKFGLALSSKRCENSITILYDYKYNISQKLYELALLFERYQYITVSDTEIERTIQQKLDEILPFENELPEHYKQDIAKYRSKFILKKLGILQDNFTTRYKAGSRRKQSKRRLRKTQHRRKRNNRKSKKSKQV